MYLVCLWLYLDNWADEKIDDLGLVEYGGSVSLIISFHIGLMAGKSFENF